MCEIFPEVESCCGVVSIRVGMILIAVLSITTGAVGLGVTEQHSNIDFEIVFDMYKNISNYSYTEPEQALSEISKLIPTTITVMSVIFMFSGIVLMFSTFTDQEGFAQIFVWLTFLCICIGMLTILAVAAECTLVSSNCLLKNMDWLTSATSLLAMVTYLLVWLYFCCVANSYVLNSYT